MVLHYYQGLVVFDLLVQLSNLSFETFFILSFLFLQTLDDLGLVEGLQFLRQTDRVLLLLLGLYLLATTAYSGIHRLILKLGEVLKCHLAPSRLEFGTKSVFAGTLPSRG